MKHFEKIWLRIKSQTNLKTLDDLAKEVGVSKPTIARKKAGDDFPAEWAFVIGDKYKLSAEWLLRGNGQQKAGQDDDAPVIIKQIAMWIQEQEKKDPGALAWFTYDFKKKYSEFDKWEKREEGDSAEHNAALKSNIA